MSDVQRLGWAAIHSPRAGQVEWQSSKYPGWKIYEQSRTSQDAIKYRVWKGIRYVGVRHSMAGAVRLVEAEATEGRDSCAVVLIALAGVVTVLIALGIQAARGMA